jgi:hypothetical protein
MIEPASLVSVAKAAALRERQRGRKVPAPATH